MYSDDDLNAAVDAGIFDADTAQAFRTLVAQRQHTLLADEEHFRLLSGFNDIFVVIACVLLLGSVAWLAGSVAPLLGAVGVAASAWGLAEFFVRQRRMALPAIALLAAFVGACAVATLIALGEQSRQDELVLLAASSAAGVAAWLHWRRFRVPLTVAAGAAAALGMVIALLLALWPALDAYTNALLLAGGSRTWRSGCTCWPHRCWCTRSSTCWASCKAVPACRHWSSCWRCTRCLPCCRWPSTVAR